MQELLQQEYGSNTVREGGLRVYTTINPGLQNAATARSRTCSPSRTIRAAAIISIDPRTGAIKAMTAVSPGTRATSTTSSTSARRQPGSTFKTITLTDRGRARHGSVPHVVSLGAAHYNPDPTCNRARTRSRGDVQTYEHTYRGVESVASATVQSDNTVYARLALDVGPANIVAMARKLGIRTSPLEPFPSITLGSVEVTPLEMASAYATLAAGGVYSKPMAITKVVLPNGKVDTDAGWGKPSASASSPTGSRRP